jgi:hypothetical protein
MVTCPIRVMARPCGMQTLPCNLSTHITLTTDTSDRIEICLNAYLGVRNLVPERWPESSKT